MSDATRERLVANVARAEARLAEAPVGVEHDVAALHVAVHRSSLEFYDSMIRGMTAIARAVPWPLSWSRIRLALAECADGREWRP